MTYNSDKRPCPADLLFKNLFKERTHLESFRLIAEGISASYKNADRLLSDAHYLVKAGRHSSGMFILTTAREEIPKSFVLLDMCRLDWDKHESVLRRLCRAFYNHIAKHAYIEVLDFWNIHSMRDVARLWEIEIKRFWPAPLESGEPDMPHNTYFEREMPLYIDFGDYDHTWLVPTNSDYEFHFRDVGNTRFSQMKDRMDSWSRAQSVGICTPEVLAVLNNVFKNQYVRESTTRKQLDWLYDRTAQYVGTETGIGADLFRESPLVQWPLYDFV